MKPPATYHPQLFDVQSLDDAMRIILTPEDSTTEHRWATETPYLADLIAGAFELSEQSLVLDYGCGIGRMAKALIERHGCKVIGVDISVSMRALASHYVGSDRFFACSPPMLDLLAGRGVSVDLGIAVWVLQHCLHPRQDMARIAGALAPRGGLFVVNQRARAIPTVEYGWTSDGADIDTLLREAFAYRGGGPLDAQHTTAVIAANAYWSAFNPLG